MQLIKLEILLLVSTLSFFLASPLSFAITCSHCEANNCVCTIEECSSGLLRIYTSSSCRKPAYEYSFDGGEFSWNAAPSGPYYFQVFCANGALSGCINITVNTVGGVTTTSSTVMSSSTTINETGKVRCPLQCCIGDPNYLDKSCPGGGPCKDNECVSQEDYTWVFILVFILIAAVVAFYFFVFRKKMKKETFSELYRKWSK